MNVYYSGHIDGEFNGFDENRLFKLDDGSYWIQAEYNYDYNYEYNPEATILDDYGTYYLLVGNKKVKVERLYDVEESRIEGDFEGWDTDKAYQLSNGDVWQQATYNYEYKYAYNPEVVIYTRNGTTYMLVDGTVAEVKKIISSSSSYTGSSGASYSSILSALSSSYLDGTEDDILDDISQPVSRENKTKANSDPNPKKKSGGYFLSVVLIFFILLGVSRVFDCTGGNSKKQAKKADEITIPYSAEDYKGRNYYDVIISLKELGISNISLSPLRDQKPGVFSKDGEIATIKVNDYYDFKSGLTVKKDAVVNISYHSNEQNERKEFNPDKNIHCILNRIDISLPSYYVEEGNDSSGAVYHIKNDEETKLMMIVSDKKEWGMLNQYDSYFIQKAEDVSYETGSGTSVMALAKRDSKVSSISLAAVWLENKTEYITFILISPDSCKTNYISDFVSIINGLFFPEESDIRIDFSLKDFKGMKYEDVVIDLQNRGFKNIKTENLHDVILGVFTKEGVVANVTINGNTDIKTGTWINEQTEIIVSYHGKK